MTDFARNWRNYQNVGENDQEENEQSVSDMSDSKIWDPVSEEVSTTKSDVMPEENEEVETLFRSKKWKELEARPALDKKVFWIISGVFVLPIIIWIVSSVWGYFKTSSTEVPVFV